jgi:hypothetical protein
LIPVVVLALTAAVYLPVFWLGFVNDDIPQIVNSQPYLAWRHLPHYFTTDVWSYLLPFRTNYYRPLFLVWLVLNAQVCGVDPLLSHLSALLTHLAATLLFFFLARRLLGDSMLGGAAALLFGVHPAHVEAVAWISGVTESLFAIFAFACILSYLRSRDDDPAGQRRWYALATPVLFGAALLTKETALVLPVLLAVYEWLFPRAGDSTPMVRLRRARRHRHHAGRLGQFPSPGRDRAAPGPPGRCRDTRATGAAHAAARFLRVQPVSRRLAAILEAKGDLAGALAEYQAELRENPDYDDVRDNVRSLSTRLGIPAGAAP